MGAAVVAMSSLSAGAAEGGIVDATRKVDQAICTQEVRTVASIRTFIVHTKDGSRAQLPLPNYEVYTIPVDCETGKRLLQ